MKKLKTKKVCECVLIGAADSKCEMREYMKAKVSVRGDSWPVEKGEGQLTRQFA